MKNLTILLLLFSNALLWGQNNEVAVQTRVISVGLSYERFFENHFSFGIAGGKGINSIEKNDADFFGGNKNY